MVDLPGNAADRWEAADWRVITESVPHIIWVADLKGRTVYFNKRGLDYTGVPPHLLTWRDLVHPDDVEEAMAGWLTAVRAEQPFAVDYRVRRLDGVYLWHACRSHPVRDAEGRSCVGSARPRTSSNARTWRPGCRRAA